MRRVKRINKVEELKVYAEHLYYRFGDNGNLVRKKQIETELKKKFGLDRRTYMKYFKALIEFEWIEFVRLGWYRTYNPSTDCFMDKELMERINRVKRLDKEKNSNVEGGLSAGFE